MCRYELGHCRRAKRDQRRCRVQDRADVRNAGGAAHPPRAVPELLGEPGRLAGAFDAERAVAGPDAGLPDIQGIDEGFSQYIRLLWQMEELPTDETAIAWNDQGVQELNTQLWSSNNQFLVSYVRSVQRPLNDGLGDVPVTYPLRFSFGLQQQTFYNFTGGNGTKVLPIVRLTLF